MNFHFYWKCSSRNHTNSVSYPRFYHTFSWKGNKFLFPWKNKITPTEKSENVIQQGKISQPVNFLLQGIICSFRLTRRDVLPSEWLLRLRAPALVGAPRPYTAIVLQWHVISSCLRRIKTAVKYQNIAIARSPPGFTVATATQNSGKKGGLSSRNAYFTLNRPPFIIRTMLRTFCRFPPSFTTFVRHSGLRILLLFHN